MVGDFESGSLEGLAFGFTNGLIYLAEALLFYVGAVLLTNGTYTYLQMIQTLNLVIFSVTVGSQLMAFSTWLLVLASNDFSPRYPSKRSHKIHRIRAIAQCNAATT